MDGNLKLENNRILQEGIKKKYIKKLLKDSNTAVC